MYYGITLKVRACQNLLHHLGFSLKRVCPAVAKADEKEKEDSKKTSFENTDR
jgi:transposase